MEKKLYIEETGGEIRVALTEDGKLAELYSESEGLTGNIYKGRVVSILPGMQAAFINIGLDKNAFLHACDAVPDGSREDAAPPISKMLRCGQELAVQVMKEPGGDKGPRVTTNLTLAGRIVVLLLTSRHIGVSKKIEPESERERLKQLSNSFLGEVGLIVRTAAIGASEEDFIRDVDCLKAIQADVLEKYARVTAPAQLYRELFAKRIVRDLPAFEILEIIVDGADTLNNLYESFSNDPEIISRLKPHKEDLRAFAYYNLESQVKKAHTKKVWLKSGGYIVIEHTEAMTVIDVNTGKFVGSRQSADTFLRLNIEAAEEIAAQLRLRDIGGIIVIDFIDMDEPSQGEALLAAFREALKRDRSKTNVGGLSGFGLVEMTRKRKYAGVGAGRLGKGVTTERYMAE